MSMNALKGVDFTLAQTHFSGFSISGLATWMVVPELNLCFDMGECPLSAVSMDHVFLTHAHGDHSRCLMRHHALRHMMGIEREAVYYIPNKILKVTEEWIRASANFEAGWRRDIKLPKLMPLSPSHSGDEPIQLVYRQNLSVHAFHADHGVPSLGYTIYDSRLKLKAEYHGLPGKELATLKRQGVAIEASLHTPRLTFIGDCTAQTLWREDHIWESKILVIESTFIGAGEEVFARRRGHTHLNEIGALLEEKRDQIHCEAIVLKHFSMKIKPLQALEAALRVIPDMFHERVYLMLSLPNLPPNLSIADLARRGVV